MNHKSSSPPFKRQATQKLQPQAPGHQEVYICIKKNDDRRYPLVICYSLLLNMAIEIVDLPINCMVIFHSYVNVYQRASPWDRFMLPDSPFQSGNCPTLLRLNVPYFQRNWKSSRTWNQVAFAINGSFGVLACYQHLWVSENKLSQTTWSLESYGSVSKPCTPGEHQNSW